MASKSSRTSKRPGIKKLSRRVGTRTPKKTVSVWCEGEKSEPEYIQALRDLPQVRDLAAVDIRIEGGKNGAVPMTLVENAVDQQGRSEIESGEVDEIWCVFDVEWPRNHPNLQQAIALARKNSIHLAISNPCFELWLMLHYKSYAAFLDNDDARRERRKLDHQKGKGVSGADYMDKRADAAARAIALETRHARNGTQFPHDNPSSGMYKLLKTVGA